MRKKKSIHYQSADISDDILQVTGRGAAGRMTRTHDQQWLVFFWWVIVGMIVLFGVRVFYMSVVHHDYYNAQAQSNSTREIPIIASRGLIHDRHGVILAENVPSFDAIVIPRELPQKEDARRAVLTRAANLLDASEEEFYELFDLNPYAAAILFKERISQDQSLALQTRAQEFPGIAVQKTAAREYIDGLIFAPIIGYEGKIRKEELEAHPEYLLIDRIGKEGIEKTYEKELRGTHGTQRYVVNSRGAVRRELRRDDPISGKELYLTIDAGLQKKLYDSVESWLERADTTTAAAIAIDPRDGAVRALVSIPSYDNNFFAKGIALDVYRDLVTNPDRPLFNRAIGGAYPPGSTLKPTIAAAALAEKIVDPSLQIESRGGIQIGNFFFGDWRAHGFTDLRRAIAVSSDVYFYSIGGGYANVSGLGIERMKKYNALFGYGDYTGIDLPAEARGFLPDKAWKQERFDEPWYIGNTYHASIGQGFITATPLQIANATAAIANGGTVYKPHVASHAKTADGDTEFFGSEVIRTGFIAPAYLEIVREGMRQTITEGTAQMLMDAPVHIAGKTGTSQYGGQDDTVHSWFTSFAPYAEPELVLTVLMEGQTSEESSTTVPIAKEVYEWYFGDRSE